MGSSRGKGFAAACAVALVLGAGARSEACVGKTIFFGKLPGKEQAVLAEIFSLLVAERTGTSIQAKAVADSRSAHTALEKAELDLYFEDPATALKEVLAMQAPAGASLRDTVRKEYEQRFNLVWLEPWGVAGRTPAGEGQVSQLAPVIRKDTLKKFPALSRLINKMSGVLDDAAMRSLVQESERRPSREVARDFLKGRKLI